MKFKILFIVISALSIHVSSCKIGSTNSTVVKDETETEPNNRSRFRVSRSTVINKLKTLLKEGDHVGTYQNRACHVRIEYPTRNSIEVTMPQGEEPDFEQPSRRPNTGPGIFTLHIGRYSTIDEYRDDGPTDVFVRAFRVKRVNNPNNQRGYSTYFYRERLQLAKLNSSGKLSLRFRTNSKNTYWQRWPTADASTCHIDMPPMATNPVTELVATAFSAGEFSLADYDCDSEISESFPEVDLDYVFFAGTAGSPEIDFNFRRESSRWRIPLIERFETPMLTSTVNPNATMQISGILRPLEESELIEPDQTPVGIEIEYNYFENGSQFSRCRGDFISGLRF